MRNGRYYLLVFSLLVLLILVFSSGVIATDSQNWYLTDIPAGLHAHDGTIHAADNIMNKIFPSSPIPEMKLIGAIDGIKLTAWWYSDSPALADVTFGEDNWLASLYYINHIGAGKLWASVWSVSPDGSVKKLLAKGHTNVKWCDGYTQVNIICQDFPDTTQTVPQGHYLALRLRYAPQQWADGLLLFYGSSSSPANLQSPPSDPGFPLPELSTAALLGSGVSLLALYAWWRCRKNGKEVRRAN
ncbi:MAG: hypothetical protein ABIN58_01050 [candidate division WOR-3 bacterium]